MHRLLVEAEALEGDVAVLPKEAARHLKVLREDRTFRRRGTFARIQVRSDCICAACGGRRNNAVAEIPVWHYAFRVRHKGISLGLDYREGGRTWRRPDRAGDIG